MDVLGDLVARDRRRSAPALSVPALGRSYSWHDYCTDSYKAGNVLRFLGLREGATVVVDPDPVPAALLAFLGAAQIGGVTRFGVTPGAVEAARVVLVPRDREGDVDAPPGTKLAVYGGSPDDPATTHWERQLWSENPQVHPATVAPDDPALVVGDDAYTHAALLAAARGVVDDLGLADGDAVAVRGPLTDPGVIAAGVVAPLLVGGRTVLAPDGTAYDAAVVGGDGGDGGDAPEPPGRTIDAATVTRA